VKIGTKELYRAKEFASLAGVTVRALHHYDRLGLLRPKQRSQAGYRLYSAQDFGRLEQIVVLKFLGIPLKQIPGLLRSEANLPGVLRRQQEVLNQKRRQLDKAIRAIGNAERSLQSRNEPDWKLFQFIVQEIEMQNKMEWKGKYFNEEARAKLAERRNLWSPEVREKADQDWAQLHADIKASLGEDPSGSRGQELAARWKRLVEAFTGGNPEILKGLKAMSEDRANWPAEAQQGAFSDPQVHEFMKKALKGRM